MERQDWTAQGALTLLLYIVSPRNLILPRRLRVYLSQCSPLENAKRCKKREVENCQINFKVKTNEMNKSISIIKMYCKVEADQVLP